MNKTFTGIALLISLAAALAAHRLIRRIVDPRKSIFSFLFYIVLHLASVFLIVWLFGIFVFRFALSR